MRNAIQVLIFASTLAACGNTGGNTTTTTLVQNTPPSGYLLNYWTDARGCQYVKTTMNGTSRWVPNVSIKGKHLCNSANSNRNTSVVMPSAPVTNVVATSVPTQNYTPPPIATIGGTEVQVGSFGVRANVDSAVAKIRAMGYDVYTVNGAKGLVAVRVRPHAGQPASALQQAMRAAGFPDAAVR